MEESLIVEQSFLVKNFLGQCKTLACIKFFADRKIFDCRKFHDQGKIFACGKLPRSWKKIYSGKNLYF